MTDRSTVADNPADWTIVEASAELVAGRISSVELTEACLRRISTRNGSFSAWIRVYEEEARDAAHRADVARAAGSAGALTGVPIGLKDVIGVAGRPLSADSAVLEGNVAIEDAVAWSRLRGAGMVLLGHLHCGEFANGVWGANPWGPESFSPGGSSSGSGIALAARMAPATLGTDGRGSIRMPAAFTGVTGIKPTFGLISTDGCIPVTFSYDVVGPMARSAADCSLLLSAMAGRDDADNRTPTCEVQGAYPRQPRRGNHPMSGTRIGIPRFASPMSSGVGSVFQRFQNELSGLGAELVEFDWPENPLEANSPGDGPHWTNILGPEAMVIHEQFQDRAELYRDEFRVLFEVMKGARSARHYVESQVKRAEYIETWTSLFRALEISAVVHPAMQDEAFGVDPTVIVDDPPRLMFGCWSDTNFPVVSIPAGLSPTDSSPVGIQVAGLPYTEGALLQVAVDYQAGTDYHLQVPQRLDDAALYRGPQRQEQGKVQPPFITPLNPFEGRVIPTASGA